MSYPPGAVCVRAPGKINLALRVGAPDDDGYHPLATVFQAVSLHEDVIASPAEGLSLTVEGRDAGRVPTDEANLALRAARLLQEHTGITAGAHLHIVKQVPVAGGMGGGSADAAAALLACDQLWDAGLDREQLVQLARRLGADVPFALTGLTAIGSGRGDVLTSAMVGGSYHWVLALQDEGLSTPEVFAAFDDDGGTHAPPPHLDDALLAALRGGDPLELARHLTNDLEEVALDLRPELGDVIAAADRAGALAAVLSGSGPTVAALAIDERHARSVAAVVQEAEVAREVLVVTGPVPGARVLERVSGS
ncbi:4-(cytidine 5'-diphospho)-2-C-methyl-D-erythritol kinase [Georgenia satyanarayanai]|uniref:4-(cytidine 5'-diphospho)-2-C-methyl-D-erythritol kinase n=1 Tax=Georgenia satyanarayanai TaxID=860221 RepID=UPI00203B7A25|nr:4-(cytidine 5'-diphospho)-2-C-methyl-D-erythritol kinase [Georgenia satyanarayanai]MCM3662205.1 4-(cytidine 5'-diphospho)-2-C-methyl-D-erythritol kinase [Georgenia satyanarayanai]